MTPELIVIGIFAVILGLASTIISRQHKVLRYSRTKLEDLKLNLHTSAAMLVIQRDRVIDLDTRMEEITTDTTEEGVIETLACLRTDIKDSILNYESYGEEVTKELQKVYPDLRVSLHSHKK